MTGSQIEPARFPLGIQYHRPPTPPPDEWESDLAHIARLGLDHIYIWVTWPYVERSQGSYAWDELERAGRPVGAARLWTLPSTWSCGPFPRGPRGTSSDKSGWTVGRARLPAVRFTTSIAGGPAWTTSNCGR